LRKGLSLGEDDIPVLLVCPWNELHLLELGPDDAGQKEAGERLAFAVSGSGLRCAPSGHKHVLKAVQNGLLEIDVSALQALNMVPGISVFTLFDGQAVAADQVVGHAQIAPLALEGRTLAAAEQIARRSGELIRVLPFVPRPVVVFVLERSEAGERARALESLSRKLNWFGCPIREVVDLSPDPTAIANEISSRVGTGPALFVVAGSNALDPLDPVFGALDQIGATMQRLGMPAHPGTLLWLASRGETAIIGLPSCGLAAQATAFDLALPRILSRGRIAAGELAALAHGGILGRAMAFRFPYHDLRERVPELETADEPVR
jgi:hypothetical protein